MRRNEMEGADKIMINDERKDNLKTSMQGTGLDLVYYWKLFEDPREFFLCDEFSCIQTVIDGIDSIVVVKTAMTPDDPYFGEGAEEKMRGYAEYVEEKWLKGQDAFDVYYLAVILKQTRVPESEQGVFKLGGKYSGSTSPARLIKASRKREYGYSISDPVKLSMVSDEYYMMDHLLYGGKRPDRKYRVGSLHGRNGHMVDEWIVMTTIGNQRYEYPIYLDAYALKPYEDAFDSDRSLYGFALDRKKEV